MAAVVRFVVSGAVTGAALFGGACLVEASGPGVMFGTLAVTMLWIGGSLMRQGTSSRYIVVATSLVVATRITAGTVSALAVATLLACGAALQVRFVDVRHAFAAMGLTIAIIAGVPGWIVLVFCALGIVSHLLWSAGRALGAALQRWRSGNAEPERTAVTVIWS